MSRWTTRLVGPRRVIWVVVAVAATSALVLALARPAEATTVRIDDWLPFAGADAAGQCPDVSIIGARGSGQGPTDFGGLGSQVWEVYDGVASALEESTLLTDILVTVGHQDVPYPAPPVTDFISFLGGSDYALSVSDGVVLTQEAVFNTARYCPETLIVLAGYSQGADVIGDALAVLEPWSGHIVGVVAIADPQFFRFESNATIYGYSGHTKDGFLDGRPLDPWIANVSAYTICHPQDIVCQGVEPSNRESIHTDSTYHGVPRQAGFELGGVLAGLLAERSEDLVPPSPGGVNTFILLDRSDSMNERDGNGVVKLDGAKSGIRELLEAAPSGARFGLSTYPSTGTDCGAGEVFAPLGTADAGDAFLGRVGGLTAAGGTPTADALRAVARNLPAELGPRAVVLISDGESNCGDDPCPVAQQLVEEGFDVQVHIFGFQISPEGAAELDCIREATGGTYVDIQDADQLVSELVALTAPVLELNVDHTSVVGVAGSPIAEVTASVSNLGLGDPAANLVVTIETAPDAVTVLPTRNVGNVAAGSTSADLVWRLNIGPTCEPQTIDFTVTASAENAAPVVSDGTITVTAASGTLICDILGDGTVAVIGDSYSSGEGAPAYEEGTDYPFNRCHRGQTYTAQGLGADRAPNLACSGAVIADFFVPNYAFFDSRIDGEVLLRPQVSQLLSLDQLPTYVFLTMGGNDLGFALIAEHCLLADGCEDIRLVDGSRLPLYDERVGELPASEQALTGREFIEARLAGLSSTLPESYRLLDQYVNGTGTGDPTQFIVLAYANLFPPADRFPADPDDCPVGNNLLGYEFTRDEVDFFNRIVDDLNSAVESAVDLMVREGRPFHFVSTTEVALAAHSLCDVEPWGHSLEFEADTAPKTPESLHPTGDGYAAIWNAFASEAAQWEPLQRTASDGPPDALCTELRGELREVDLTGDGSLTFSPGDCVVMVIRGLSPSTSIEYLLQSDLRVLATTITDESGTGSAVVRIPDRIEPGTHTVSVLSSSPDGILFLAQWPVEIEQPLGLPLIAAIVAVGLFLLSGAWLLVTSRAGRRARAAD